MYGRSVFSYDVYSFVLFRSGTWFPICWRPDRVFCAVYPFLGRLDVVFFDLSIPQSDSSKMGRLVIPSLDGGIVCGFRTTAAIRTVLDRLDEIKFQKRRRIAMSVPEKTKRPLEDVSCDRLRQVLDKFLTILLGYAGWEGKDRGILIPGLLIGVMYAILYFKTNPAISGILERIRERLLAKQPSTIVSRFLAYTLPLFLRLVFCNFLFLFLVWQTILYYEKNFKF